MEILVGILGGAAAVAWLVAAVSWLISLGHLAEGMTLGKMLFQGYRAFDPKSYAESGRPHHRRFLIATGVFFLLILAALALSAATGAVSTA